MHACNDKGMWSYSPSPSLTDDLKILSSSSYKIIVRLYNHILHPLDKMSWLVLLLSLLIAFIVGTSAGMSISSSLLHTSHLIINIYIYRRCICIHGFQGRKQLHSPPSTPLCHLPLQAQWYAQFLHILLNIFLTISQAITYKWSLYYRYEYFEPTNSMAKLSPSITYQLAISCSPALKPIPERVVFVAGDQKVYSPLSLSPLVVSLAFSMRT